MWTGEPLEWLARSLLKSPSIRSHHTHASFLLAWSALTSHTHNTRITSSNDNRTVLTASFTESSLLKLLWDMSVLACTAHLVDGLLDPPRLALFILVVAVGSAVFTSVSIFLGFVATRWEDLFFTPTYGFAGLLCGLFVLAKQRAPTEAVLPGGVLPAFRAQHLPFAWLCACAAVRLLVGGVEGGVGMVSDLPLAFWGLFVSWCVPALTELVIAC